MFYGYSAYNEQNLIYRFIIVCLLSGGIDLAVYFIYRYVLKPGLSKKIYRLINLSHWAALLVFVGGGTILYIATGYPCDNAVKLLIYTAYFTLFFVWYFPKMIFVVLYVVWLIFTSFIWLLKKKNKNVWYHRYNYIFFRIDLIIVIIVALIFVYGLFFGRTHFVIKNETISFSKLPAAFDGYKIVQISDIHLGNVTSKHSFEKAITLINGQHPDMIVFTGDMVNLTAKEALPFVPAFRNLTPSTLKYAILGNHDFGDYALCYDQKKRQQSIDSLILIEGQMGFRVLLNSHVSIRRGNDSIILAGVKNWSKKPYHQYGNIREALKDVPDSGFIILLSHDPEHWDVEVAGRTNVSLTLSGHTHGAQMGYEFGKYRWSPYKFKENLWAGLYNRNNQYLYINQGLGVIGILARIGIWPEITVITLRKGK
jgi:predicted MPP superfamily phosphohydrolase